MDFPNGSTVTSFMRDFSTNTVSGKLNLITNK